MSRFAVLAAAFALSSGHLHAEKRPGGRVPYVPSGFETPEELTIAEEVDLALDVNGGREPHYFLPADPSNVNHLYSLEKVGDEVMIVSRVDGMALDANGGAGNPYPMPADASNVNHLWLLAKVGDHYMIWSKAANAVLDANGGRIRPYLSTNPDARNINHLWELRPAGDAFMLIPKVKGRTERTVAAW